MGPFRQAIIEELEISEDLQSWLIGSVSLGGLVGSLLAGKLADIIGRKSSTVIYFSISTVGWLMVALAYNYEMVFCGRIIHGLGEGMALVISVIYVGEIIEENYRGAAIVSLTVSSCLGTSTAYVLGVCLTWRVSAGLVAVIGLASLFCLVAVPESSIWEAQKNEEDIHEKLLEKLK